MPPAKPPRPNGLRPRPRALLGVPLGGAPLGGVPLGGVPNGRVPLGGVFGPDWLIPSAGGLPKFVSSHPGRCLCCPGHRVLIWRPTVATAPSLCDRCGDGAAGGDGAAAYPAPPLRDAEGAAAVPGSARLGDSPMGPHTRLRPGVSSPCCVFAELWQHMLAEPSVSSMTSSSEPSAPGMSAGRRRIASAPLADRMTMRGVLAFEPTSFEEPIDSSRTRRSSARSAAVSSDAARWLPSSCATRVASAETVSSCSRRARSSTELRSASSCARRSIALTMLL